MRAEELQEKRIQGAEEIVKTLRQMAESSGIAVTKIEWNYGRDIIDRETHNLTVEAGDKKGKEEFKDDELINFPTKSGTAVTLGKMTIILSALNS